MEIWTSGGLRAEMDTRGSVLFVAMTGLMTPGPLGDYYRRRPTEHPVAYCLHIDITRAMVLMSADEMLASLSTTGLSGRFKMPAAILCRAEDYELFQTFGRCCADIGVVRVPFKDARRACAWCLERAESARLAQLSAQLYRASSRVRAH